MCTVPRCRSRVSPDGSTLKFKSEPNLSCYSDNRSTPSIALDGEGLQFCELAISFIGIGSAVRIFRESDGIMQALIVFHIDFAEHQEHGEDQDIPIGDESAHIVFRASAGEDYTSWAHHLPEPPRGKADRDHGAGTRYVAHVPGWSNWSALRNGQADDVKLQFLFDFDRRMVRVAFVHEVMGHMLPSGSLRKWGPEFPLGDDKVRLGLHGWFGDEKMKIVEADGNVKLKWITAQVTAPPCLPPYLRTSPHVLRRTNGACHPAGCRSCRLALQKQMLNEWEEYQMEERWSCDLARVGCWKPSDSANPWKPGCALKWWVCEECDFASCDSCYQQMLPSAHEHRCVPKWW